MKILVAGELNADLVMSGLPSLPVLGRELTGQDFRMVMGSSSAITAARLAALGAAVDFVGLIGKDDIGRFVLHELAGFGVGTAAVQVVEAVTGVTIVLTYSSDRAMLTFPGTMAEFDGKGITREMLGEYRHLHVGSFFLQTGLQPRLPELFAAAHDMGLTTSLDVGWDPTESWLKNPYLAPTLAVTDYFFPNQDETTALLAGEQRPEKLAALVGGTLLVKRGAQGAAAYRASGLIASAPALPVQVVDTTGAGDAFNAGFLYATCVRGASMQDALRFAVACGSQAVTRVGGATDSPDAAAIDALLAAQNGGTV